MLFGSLPFAIHTSAKQIISILRILCYNGSLVTWTVVSLTTAKFKPLIFFMFGFALSYATNTFILMILYNFCLFPAQFYYIIVYIWRLNAVCKSRTMCTLENCQWCGQSSFVCDTILITGVHYITLSRTAQKTSLPSLRVLSLVGKGVHRAVPA
jgi:hypothetical protein